MATKRTPKQKAIRRKPAKSRGLWVEVSGYTVKAHTTRSYRRRWPSKKG